MTAADVTDRQAARVMLPRLREKFRKITLIWADGGYTGRLVTWAREKLQLTLEIVKRSDDMSGFVVLPRRWCVERTLGWLMRSLRLVRDFETLPASSETFVYFSMAMLMSRRIAIPAPARAGTVGSCGVNRPDGNAVTQPRSASRLAFERTPSVFAGTAASPSRPASSFAEMPSPAPGSASTSSTIRRQSADSAKTVASTTGAAPSSSIASRPAKVSASSAVAITRRSNNASASSSSARTRSASTRSSSARTRAAASRSSTSAIADVTLNSASPRPNQTPELFRSNAHTMPDQRKLNDHIRKDNGF